MWVCGQVQIEIGIENGIIWQGIVICCLWVEFAKWKFFWEKRNVFEKSEKNDLQKNFWEKVEKTICRRVGYCCLWVKLTKWKFFWEKVEKTFGKKWKKRSVEGQDIVVCE